MNTDKVAPWRWNRLVGRFVHLLYSQDLHMVIEQLPNSGSFRYFADLHDHEIQFTYTGGQDSRGVP